MSNNNLEKFKILREKYPLFTYESYSMDVQKNELHLKYHFSLAGKCNFYPNYTIPLGKFSIDHINSDLLHSLVFHIGMAELVSYWKAACSPEVLIKPFKMNADQQKWWKQLYILGLGEFFYLNGIEASSFDFFSFSFEKYTQPVPRKQLIETHHDGVIIPVGGGKDSLVTLSVLSREENAKMAMAINPGKATIESVNLAGLKDNFFSIQRTIDPALIELNRQGFLNGHTPFSSVVAFVSILVSSITGHKNIALSNESSANEATIPGTTINHQYSKSYGFEKDFRRYVSRFISPDYNYFSLLRPLNELQIAAIFSQNPKFFSIFRSCNVGSKTNSWCCNCPKCLFTYIMLAPFLESEKLVEIFGENLLEKESLIPLMKQLSGLAAEKPFECVGTIDEVNSALRELWHEKNGEELPVLLRHHKECTGEIRFKSVAEQMTYWNGFNSLYQHYTDLLRESLEQSINPRK
ncbi:MAG: hypothetical protein EA361_17365 [Bacteroidetes bacterium]|nr:MAG: hypothetical protein EA361_17365 [Bacteroidota bacterium]